MKYGIYLVGFSGSGKSTVAQIVGKQLKCPAYDLDNITVERSGMTIPIIFEREGESGFRLREAEALRSVSNSERFVVATGGGTPLRAANRQFMAGKGWIICLEGRPETLLGRIQRQFNESDPNAIRPLLAAMYPLDQVRTLKSSRQSIYALADWTIHTDRLTSEEVAAEVIRAVELLELAQELPEIKDTPAMPMGHSLSPELPPPIMVSSEPWPYQVVIGWNHLHLVGSQIRRQLPQARRIAVITDADVWNRVGDSVKDSVEAAGLKLQVRVMRSDERTKTIEEVNVLYDWLFDIQMRRSDIILIVGGGTIDDLGSFTASTYMRGIPLVKVPTSLEGMVDSSIGGKTALNHPRSHNLVGGFYHPRLVWSDVSLVRFEPPHQVRAAWAEVVKYAMLEGTLLRDQVLDTPLFDQLEKHAKDLIGLNRPMLLNVIARCVALKARVVSDDERDFGQYRIFLNYGHTVGHALEKVTDYDLAHGEAVALGMAVAARLAVRLGLADPAIEVRQNDLLSEFGLPTRLPPVSQKLLLQFINKDKKAIEDGPRWILPVTVGRAVVSNGVSKSELIAALEEVSSS